MAQAIYERLDQGYRGFVIAHGTDTMDFSASALAFAFGDRLNLPIVFTGAQTTPEVVHGGDDARVNLLRAVKIACEDLRRWCSPSVNTSFAVAGCKRRVHDASTPSSHRRNSRSAISPRKFYWRPNGCWYAAADRSH